MKVNFSLSDIELNIEDDIIESSEILEQNKALKGLHEVEKNLWVVRIEDPQEGLVEPEIQMAAAKVKNVTCDCSVFNQHIICSHIGLGLLALRRKKTADKEAKEAAKAPKRTQPEVPSKLTIPHILKRIESQQLIEFIADYARHDKQFALALKTRFTGDLTQGDSIEHYKTLIENTLKNAKNPKGKLTPKGWLQFFTLLDELNQKSETYFKKGELNDSFGLLKLSLPLIHRYLRSYDAPHFKLNKRQVQLMEILRGYSEVLVSPELNENIFDFILTEYNNNVKFDFSNPLFEWLLRNVYTQTELEKVLQTIEKQIQTQRGNFDVQDKLLTQKIKLLQRNGKVEEASKMILSASKSPDILLFAIQTAVANGDTILAKDLCANGLKMFKNMPHAVEQIEVYLLEIAVKEQDTEGVLHYAEKCFLRTFQWQYFQWLIEYNMSSDKIHKIIETIEKMPYKIEKRDILAAIYFNRQLYDKLIDFTKSLQSLELLKRYGWELWKIDAEKSLSLHKYIIYEYLYTHLGRPPAQRIRTLIESHILEGGKDLADALMIALKKDFPERYSLKEELDDMLLELEKKQALVR